MLTKKTLGTKKPRKRIRTDRFLLIEKSLRKQAKVNLIELLLRLAKENAALARDLETTLAVEKPIDLLMDDLASAIDRATDFDERKMNYNFDVDWQAYKDVGQGLKKLIKLGLLEDAKSLALRLMRDGSYQVECSDEGMMLDEIEKHLRPVIKAARSDKGKDAAKWAVEMLRADRVGYICDRELKNLAGQT